MQVTLRVPLADADHDGLAEFPGNDDEPQERAGHVIVEVTSDSVRKVATDARAMFRGRRVSVDGDVVTVEPDDARWFKAMNLGSSAYDRAIRAAVRGIAADRRWRDWWSRAGYTTLLFHQIRRDGRASSDVWGSDLLLYVPVDGSRMDDESASDALTAAARANVGLVLEEAASVLSLPLPRPDGPATPRRT